MLFSKTLFVAVAGLSAMAFAAPVENSAAHEPTDPLKQLNALAKDPCNGNPNHAACDKARHKKGKGGRILAIDPVDAVETVDAVDAVDSAMDADFDPADPTQQLSTSAKGKKKKDPCAGAKDKAACEKLFKQSKSKKKGGRVLAVDDADSVDEEF
ncbi:hypothetical protein EG328_003592 [Venturia inaequalis]|uniref:Uncharacterized protein n=1 Tax=Venturia inaequalis TaxID=5025 RepID=A0A8H3UQD1_VENIN|nr:hypothetical protein EG328_003592 [Venturia inaequalis]